MTMVAKFGGTSMANAAQIRKVIGIVKSDPARRYVVVSAPGKRSTEDVKVTDLFYEWHQAFKNESRAAEIQEAISERFQEIVNGLGVRFDLARELDQIRKSIIRGLSADYAASRGEYLNGKILAQVLGYPFLDPAEYIHFKSDGSYDPRQIGGEKLRKALISHSRAIIPGFYGSLPNGTIKTFPRQGSDITGAIVAKAAGAKVYENWKDVSGIFMADPEIVRGPEKIDTITYREMRELAYMGAAVFHEDAVIPLQEAGITSRVLNTDEPDDPGTMIVPNQTLIPQRSHHGVVGIAARSGFIVLRLEKMSMRKDLGFIRKVLSVFERHSIPCEQIPSGIDAISFVLEEKYFSNTETVMREIKHDCHPDKHGLLPGIAMIAIVGRGMAHRVGVASRSLDALSNHNINVSTLSQDAGEISIMVGVANKDRDDAVRAIYGAITT